MNNLIETTEIKTKIYTIRGVRVMLDRDLAELYQVETRRLNEQVKRNIKRFSDDFMFQLTKDEFDSLISQIATSSWGGVRKLPLVFTELGVAMLSSILNSEIAIEINKKIIRIFISLRQQISLNPQYELLKEKINSLEAETKTIKLNQIVDGRLISDKVTGLSGEVHQISQILNEFQNSYVIVKRPEDGSNKG